MNEQLRAVGSSAASQTPADITGDPSEFPQWMLPGLRMLRQADAFSRDLECSPWDFAVEINSLRQTGVTDNDLRWLHRKGYVKNAREITESGSHQREFQERELLLLTDESCFVLTELGTQQLADVVRLTVHGDDAPRQPPTLPLRRSEPAVPQWDSELREFRLSGLVIKRFKTPSPNQETILAAFDEEGWPPRVDDPLPGVEEIDPKQRLHDTIKSLNRNQLNQLVRFRGDGTGVGICWEPTDS